MSSRLPTDEALEKEDRIDEIKKKKNKTEKKKKKKNNNKKTTTKKHSPSNPHLLQAQQAPAIAYAKVVGRYDTQTRTLGEGAVVCGGMGVGDRVTFEAFLLDKLLQQSWIFIPAVLVWNRHFGKKYQKCLPGKPSSQTAIYGLNTVNFLFVLHVWIFIYFQSLG